jgi:hypothetical protein
MMYLHFDVFVCGLIHFLAAWRAQQACLRLLADLRINAHLGYWSMYLAYFVDFHHFELGVPNQRACVPSETSEKTCSSSFEGYVLCTLLILCFKPHGQLSENTFN